MNPLDNRYERNPAFFRDMPENLFEDKGVLLGWLYQKNSEIVLNCHLPYKCDGIDFTVDCSLVKDNWNLEMRDDIFQAIETKFGSFFLSRKDLNLNIIGL